MTSFHTNNGLTPLDAARQEYRSAQDELMRAKNALSVTRDAVDAATIRYDAAYLRWLQLLKEAPKCSPK